MCKKLILLTALLAALTLNASAGGVTNIKEVYNNSGVEITVTKLEGGQTTASIPPGGVWTGDMWIPWVDNADQFRDKRLEIRARGTAAAWIWQSGDHVRYNTSAMFVADGQRAPGEATSGGERTLFINSPAGGGIQFVLAPFMGISNAGGITNIREIVNQSRLSVSMAKFDLGKGWETLLRGPGPIPRSYYTISEVSPGTSWQGEMWVPWADNRSQFQEHWMLLRVHDTANSRLLNHAVYQSGAELRSSRARSTGIADVSFRLNATDYVANAARLSGEYRSGGNRRIVFYDNPDGSVAFRFERIP